MDNFQPVHFKEVVNNKLERFRPGNSLIDQLEKGKSQQISHGLNISEHQQNHTFPAGIWIFKVPVGLKWIKKILSGRRDRPHKYPVGGGYR